MFHDAAGEFTAPLVRLVKEDISERNANYASLAEDWPWWSAQEYSIVKPEIQAAPRWKEWVEKTKV